MQEIGAPKPPFFTGQLYIAEDLFFFFPAGVGGISTNIKLGVVLEIWFWPWSWLLPALLILTHFTSLAIVRVTQYGFKTFLSLTLSLYIFFLNQPELVSAV